MLNEFYVRFKTTYYMLKRQWNILIELNAIYSQHQHWSRVFVRNIVMHIICNFVFISIWNGELGYARFKTEQ